MLCNSNLEEPEMQETRSFFKIFAIAAVVVIALGVIFTPGTAIVIQGWISPITNLNGVTVESGSPYAFIVEQCSNEDYYKVLVYMTPEDRNDIYPVNIYGYYWHQKEYNTAVYSLWIPDYLPTGKYEMVVSIQGRAWIEVNDDFSGPYGPWMEYSRRVYTDIVVINNGNNYVLGSTENVAVSSNVKSVGEVESNLNEAQKSVLLKTLQEEVAQKGGKI